jgi:hypothetical protein
MKRTRQIWAWQAATAGAAMFLLAGAAQAAPLIFSDSGADASGIVNTVDAFRAAIGGVNNGNTPGVQPGGRREINWDGGGAGAPPTFAATPMTNFAFRGNVNTTPGTGFEISGEPLPRFGDINPGYSSIFQTFSTPRLFTPLGSNVLDVLFTVPGTTNVFTTTQAFGAVFVDVDLDDTTKMEFFDANGNLLEDAFVTEFNEGLSFLGAIFAPGESIARVRITLGNRAIGPNDGDLIDVVVLDDFIYAEPNATTVAVPEPGTLTLLGLGLALLLAWRRAQ